MITTGRRPILGLAVLAMLAMTSCISTTTNVAPKTDDADAARKYYQLGAHYFHNGNYELARDRLQRAIGFNPNLAIAHSVLALTFERLGNERLAAEHHRRAVRAEPSNHIVRNAYAVYLCGRKQFEDAREQFDRSAAIRDNDDAEMTLTNAGVCFSNKPDLAQAEAYFRRALDENPRYGEALLQMAALMYRTEEYLQARAFIQRYFSSNRATPEALYLAVQIETSLGDDDARGTYETQLLREFPRSAQARQVLAAS